MENTLNQLRLYNNWANETVLKSFDSYGSLIPASALRLLSHIVNTQLVWLSRINGAEQTAEVWADHSAEVCREIHNQTSTEIKKLLSALHNRRSERIKYANTKGILFENSINDILVHLFNHGTYHRAQIAQEMRKAGLEPANTDYINFVRYASVL